MVDETESGACGTVGYLRDGRRSVEEQCPVEDTYQFTVRCRDADGRFRAAGRRYICCVLCTVVLLHGIDQHIGQARFPKVEHTPVVVVGEFDTAFQPVVFDPVLWSYFWRKLVISA